LAVVFSVIVSAPISQPNTGSLHLDAKDTSRRLSEAMALCPTRDLSGLCDQLPIKRSFLLLIGNHEAKMLDGFLVA
jgi:hypothetical protein